jgi:hypothetical protein
MASCGIAPVRARAKLKIAARRCAVEVMRHIGSSIVWVGSVGQFNAADTLLLTTGNRLTRQSLEDAARVLRPAPNAGRPATLPQFTSERNFVFSFVGAPGREFEFPERLAEIGHIAPIANSLLWYPSSAPLRRTRRFKDYVRKIGLADYWRARGWPDMCDPVGADDFECN